MTDDPSSTASAPRDDDPSIHELDEVTADLPVNLKADFVPPEEMAGDGSELTDRNQRDSRLAEELFSQAVAAAEGGDEDQAVKHYLHASKLAEHAREWYIAAVCCHRVGDFLKNPRPPHDIERAFRMYRRAIVDYEACGLFAEARELAYRLMHIKMRRARHLGLPLWQRIELVVFWATAGFGYRPLRVLGAAVALVFAFALLYWSIDGVTAVRSAEPITFWQTLYFSGTTFATVGYGDFLPAPHARLIALTESAIGPFAMGFFVVVLANRLKG